MAYTVIEAPSETAAQDALTKCGFSLGRLQRAAPRGILHGDWDIAKWRNLSQTDIDGLDGIYTRQHRDGPVTLTFRETVSAEHIIRLRTAFIQ